MARETRSYRFCELRASQGDELAISGYAARFNSASHPIPAGNGSTFVERILPGAFTKVLADPKTDVRCLFNHDSSKVLGRQKSGTLTLNQDSKGLAFRVHLDKNNSDHCNLHASVKRGDITGASFGFTTDDDDFDQDSKGQTRRTIRSFNSLVDVSVVTSPAYEAAEVNARSVGAREFIKKLFPGYQKTDIQRFVDQGIQIAREFGSETPASLFAASLRNGISLDQLVDAEMRAKAELQGKVIRTSGTWGDED